MFNSIKNPWTLNDSPLYKHIYNNPKSNYSNNKFGQIFINSIIKGIAKLAIKSSTIYSPSQKSYKTQ